MYVLIFPHQLFDHHPGLDLNPDRVVLIEDSLFFGDARYPLRFHQQKLALHRGSMKRYESKLRDEGFQVEYIEYESRTNALKRQLKQILQSAKNKPKRFTCAHPTDFLLEKRLQKASSELGVDIDYLTTPGFLNQPEENTEYRSGRKRWFMADFYKWQRQRLDVLMDGGEPVGGKWSFDEDNRKKVPRKRLESLPDIPQCKQDAIDQEAITYVQKRFSSNLGKLERIAYPTSHKAASLWLDDFLEQRFALFGDYEDAIVPGESWLWHSVLTPALNIGLLTPEQVLSRTLSFADENEIPINSLEGFVRQIIGWREFMRATYQDLGVPMRTTNHWNHQRKIPDSFYTGHTGIEPIDDTIERVLQTGYCHHIERLMVLGGFMFLCEFHPNEIYNWFMEMFIDSYDWVMVPNVYAMSQHADGGLITTKPYFSGSSYIRKMSHYPRGDWCDIWDGLYWRWILEHHDQLAKNPRWAMMCSMARKMPDDKRQNHRQNARAFLNSL